MTWDVQVIVSLPCTGTGLLQPWKKCASPKADGSEWEKADRQELIHTTDMNV